MLQKLPAKVGRAIRSRRAGFETIAINKLGLSESVASLELTSPTFEDGCRLPKRYTADGEGLSPPLTWRGLPESACTAVLLVEDADSPTKKPLVHAIVLELDAGTGELAEGALNSPHDATDGIELGRNSMLNQGWLPPDPPPGHGTHRYVFEFFALRKGVALSEAPGRKELLNAVFDRAVAANYLIGTYERRAAA